MKHTFFYLLLLATLVSACSPSQKVTSYWVNKDAIPKEPFKTIYIMAITKNENMQPAVENELADVLVSRGHKVVLNS
jgi:hypothetical protein